MKITFILAAFLLSLNANAFPSGIFECGKGQTTSRVEIEKVTVGMATLPRLKVTLRRPDLDSELIGMGLLLTIKDKKTGEIERRLTLPGSNFDLRYTENDELELLSAPKRCSKVEPSI